MLKQGLVLFIASLLAVPVWSGTPSLGFVGSATNATLDGTEATAGLSIFEGEPVKVLPGGSLGVLLKGGTRAAFSSDSEANFERSGSHVVMNLKKGMAFLATSANSPVEGSLGDVTFRPAQTDRPAIGWLELNSAGHVTLYADRGDWLVSTAHDGRTMTLREGSRLEGSAASAPQSNDQQHKKKNRKMAIIWIGAPLAGVATGLAFAFGKSECTLAGGNPPATNPSCTPPAASPVTP